MAKKNFKKEFSSLLGDNKTKSKGQEADSGISFSETPTTVKKIVLSDLTVRTVEQTKTAIEDGLNSGMNIEIVAEDIESIDLSYVQLILAIEKNSSKNSVSFSFKGEMPERIRKMLDSSGFSMIE